jgi:TRAP-type transport system periplasmic protein
MKFKTLIAALGAAATISFTTAAKADELSIATFLPPPHHINSNLFKWLGEELKKRSGGTLTTKLYPAGQLGAGPVQQYKRVVEGVADITFGLQAYTPKIFPRTMLIIPPGKAIDSIQATKRLLTVYDEHLKHEYKDVKMLGVFTVAGAAWAGTKDLSTMAGLKGAKLVPYAAMTSPIIEALGAVPVQMPVTEMYTGISTGTVDSVTAAYSNIPAPWNFWDVSKHVADNVPVQFAVFFVAMNKERYLGLSDAHRKIIDDIAGELFSLKGAESFHNTEMKAYGLMKSSPKMGKVKVTVVNDAERAKMDAAVKQGLEVIFKDMEKRGIKDARAIYTKINK